MVLVTVRGQDLTRTQQSEPYCKPVIIKPPPIGGDYNRDANARALKGRGLINHGCTLTGFGVASGLGL